MSCLLETWFVNMRKIFLFHLRIIDMSSSSSFRSPIFFFKYLTSWFPCLSYCSPFYSFIRNNNGWWVGWVVVVVGWRKGKIVKKLIPFIFLHFIKKDVLWNCINYYCLKSILSFLWNCVRFLFSTSPLPSPSPQQSLQEAIIVFLNCNRGAPGER